MDRDISAGLQLDQPRLLLQEEGTLGRGIFYGLLMLLGGLGGWGCLITAFGLEVYPVRLALIGTACCAFTVWRQTDPRKRWWSLSLLGWAAWLIILVFAFDGIAHGAVRTVNLILDCYGTKLNYGLPSLSLPYQAGTRAVDPVGECTSFIAVLLFPFFWAMGRMWIKSRNNRGPFGLTGMLVLMPMSFSIIPAGWAFGAVVLFWCMLLLLASTLGGPEGSFGRRKRRRGYKASGVGAARPTALLLCIAMGLGMWGVYLYAPEETYKRPELAESLRTGVREGFGSSQYLRGGQGNSNKEVQLGALGSRAYTGETMLRVRFDWQEDPESVGSRTFIDDNGIKTMIPEWVTNFSLPENAHKEYLKSFVGTVYTGHSWERLDSGGSGRLEELEFTAQNQIAANKHEMYVPGRDRHDWYTLSVQNLGANPRCVYIPASLRSGGEELSRYEIELVDDGFARSKNFINGSREYRLEGEARCYGSNYFSRVLGRYLYEAEGISDISNLGSAKVGNIGRDKYNSMYYDVNFEVLQLGDIPYFTELDGPYELFDSINSQANIAGAGWPDDLWEVPEFEAWESFDIEQRELLRSVEEYNKFVYDYYTQVPEELQGFLEGFMDAYELDPLGHIEAGDFRYKDGPEYYAGRIADIFKTYFTYDLNPPVLPEGTDFVEYFLSESHEGYCVHFASAAVMLLRAAGYPARYAEGYVVPSGNSGWVDIPDYNAHAWAEVYCGGTGWIPVEVTPAAADNPASFYNATMPENPEQYIPTPVPETERPTLPPRQNRVIENELGSPTPRPTAPASPSPGPGASGGGSGHSNTRLLLNILWVLSVIAAIFAAVFLQRLLRIKKRQRDLSQPDRNAAALRAYGYLLKLYEKSAYCGEREPMPERWKELAEKARFSAHTLSEEELSELLEDAGKLRERLKRELPRGRKILCWLTGLI